MNDDVGSKVSGAALEEQAQRTGDHTPNRLFDLIRGELEELRPWVKGEGEENFRNVWNYVQQLRTTIHPGARATAEARTA